MDLCCYFHFPLQDNEKKENMLAFEPICKENIQPNGNFFHIQFIHAKKYSFLRGKIQISSSNAHQIVIVNTP